MQAPTLSDIGVLQKESFDLLGQKLAALISELIAYFFSFWLLNRIFTKKQKFRLVQIRHDFVGEK